MSTSKKEKINSYEEYYDKIKRVFLNRKGKIIHGASITKLQYEKIEEYIEEAEDSRNKCERVLNILWWNIKLNSSFSELQTNFINDYLTDNSCPIEQYEPIIFCCAKIDDVLFIPQKIIGGNKTIKTLTMTQAKNHAKLFKIDVDLLTLIPIKVRNKVKEQQEKNKEKNKEMAKVQRYEKFYNDLASFAIGKTKVTGCKDLNCDTVKQCLKKIPGYAEKSAKLLNILWWNMERVDGSHDFEFFFETFINVDCNLISFCSSVVFTCTGKTVDMLFQATIINTGMYNHLSIAEKEKCMDKVGLDKDTFLTSDAEFQKEAFNKKDEMPEIPALPKVNVENKKPSHKPVECVFELTPITAFWYSGIIFFYDPNAWFPGVHVVPFVYRTDIKENNIFFNDCADEYTFNKTVKCLEELEKKMNGVTVDNVSKASRPLTLFIPKQNGQMLTYHTDSFIATEESIEFFFSKMESSEKEKFMHPVSSKSGSYMLGDKFIELKDE